MLSYTFYMSETCARLCSVSHSQLSSSEWLWWGWDGVSVWPNVVTVPITLDYLQKSQEFSSSSEVWSRNSSTHSDVVAEELTPVSRIVCDHGEAAVLFSLRSKESSRNLWTTELNLKHPSCFTLHPRVCCRLFPGFCSWISGCRSGLCSVQICPISPNYPASACSLVCLWASDCGRASVLFVSPHGR